MLNFRFIRSGKATSYLFYLSKRGKKPVAFVNTRHLDSNLVEGAILADVPMLCFPEKDPCELISTGDRVEVDGERGLLLKLSNGDAGK
ncbi:MAG: DUF126 domain-containing protein [Desulfobacterales bacterium]|nr:MAG: DUF126 domain-containing protein [Desulfobacterales bacterium]